MAARVAMANVGLDRKLRFRYLLSEGVGFAEAVRRESDNVMVDRRHGMGMYKSRYVGQI
jgi:hypothetical protein